MNAPHRVLVLDFGSQTTQLIARRVRELEVYCEIIPGTASMAQIQEFEPDAIILSGGPASVSAEFSPAPDAALWDTDLPMLGICYGMQTLVQRTGGEVRGALHREFGRAILNVDDGCPLFARVESPAEVWMSHGDQVESLPEGYTTFGRSKTCPHAVIGDAQKRRYGVQFHPEVAHTPQGSEIIASFLFDVAGLKPSWQMSAYVDRQVERIQEQVGDGHVIMAVSGGVDSTVAAALVNKAIGDQLTCVYVDHGLHREGEPEEVDRLLRKSLGLDLRVIEAEDLFMKKLAGLSDPEQKRKAIGATFIELFEGVAKELGDVAFLGQGTLYPDVIESVTFHGGPSAVIKSHHNVGGLPERMHLKLVEPLRELFKDEVRKLGAELGLDQKALMRQPFPGPGLAIRILGAVDKSKCDLLRAADAIVREEIDAAIADKRTDRPLWQWFAVLLPVRSVGVMGDARTYEETICVRCVESVDAMTADWAKLPPELLGRISGRIINEVRGVNRVVYDISSKPPATIEWE